VLLICCICKKEYSVKPYRAEISRCCSKNCLWHYTKSVREPKRLKKIIGFTAHNNQQLFKNCTTCNQRFNISPSRKDVKRFCSTSCYAISQRSLELPKKRYKRITVNGKRVLEHRHIIEQQLGRKLNKREHIHHKDRNRHNNNISNLEVIDIVEHGKISNSHRGT